MTVSKIPYQRSVQSKQWLKEVTERDSMEKDEIGRQKIATGLNNKLLFRIVTLLEDLSFAEKPLQTVKENDYLYILDYLSFSFLYLRAAKIRCFTLYFDFSRA